MGIGRIGFAVALALAGAIAVFGLRKGVETDLFSLIGDKGPGDSVVRRLNEVSADSVRVLCADEARAKDLRARYPFDPPMDPETFLSIVRTHGKGLLAPQAREQLEKGELDRLRRSVKRRDYSGVGLFPKAEDPNYFLNDFVIALKALQPEGLPEGAVILTGRGTTIDASVPGGGLLALVREAEADDGLWLSGSPFHTVLARQQTIREVNLLGALSLVAVLLFGWLLFRSFRFVLPMVGAIACGFLLATGAVCLLPGRPHALTFLFGTTLIGLGVDYCYHALSSERAASDFVRKLTGALVTTCFAFAPLLFSSVSVLRQMSVFTIAGLVAISACVLLFVRPLAGTVRPIRALAKIRFAPFVYVLAVVVLLVGLPLLSRRAHDGFSSDPAVFHRPAPVMARGEAKFASLSGGGAGLRIVNLTRWQKENAALKAKLGEEPGGVFLSAADLPAGLAFTREGEDFLVLPEAAASAIVGERGMSVDLRKLLQSLFARFMSESLVQAGVALTLLFVAAVCVFRRRALSVFLPPAAAAVLTFLLLVLMQEPITFFHLLCFFILIGLGIDYAIFHRIAEPNRDVFPAEVDWLRIPGEKGCLRLSNNPIVFFSFLTSLVGFGLLAFTSFPVTRGMGITLAIGLFWAYSLSLPLGDRPRRGGDRPRKGGDRPHGDEADSAAWHRQKEQSAGRFRILLMWYIYKFLGKNVAKILFLPGYLFIYPFCRPARAALREFYDVLGIKGNSFKHILNFAWSMLDKTDACALCKDPPRMSVVGDKGWMKGGCFLLSTHLGCIEVLPALRKTWGQTPQGRGQTPKVHAFQQMGHNAIFTEIFAKNLDNSQLTLHAVEDIGVETAVEMQEAIGRGEIVLMAADRLSAGSKASLVRPFFGRKCKWPKGVLRFAKMMECPIYGITCVSTGWNAYEVRARRLSAEDLLDDYISFLEGEVRRHPLQWYQFYRFFD